MARVQASARGQAAQPGRTRGGVTASRLQHALLFWQIPAFLLTGLLVFALPKVKPSSTVPAGA